MPAGRARDDDAVDPFVRKAAARSWRLLVILGAVLAVLWLVEKLQVIPGPRRTGGDGDRIDGSRGLARPPRRACAAARWHSCCSPGMAVFGGILTFVVSQFVSGLAAFTEQVTRSIDNATKWLIEGPAHLSHEQIEKAGDAAVKALRDNQEKLTSGALSTAATLTEMVTGALLVLFTTIFLLYGGRNIYAYLTRIVPAAARERVRAAGRAGSGS